MQRRDVLRGLAALPFAGALSSCEGKSDDKSHANTLEIHLDGAFALVIQENKSNSLVAFSPRPKPGDEQHLFYVNGSRKPEDSTKGLKLKLSPDGIDRDSKPEINPGLNDFHFRTKRWSVGDSLVTVELPAPKKITFAGHREEVFFKSGHRRAFLPTNHVLKYDLKDAAKLKMECSDPRIRCMPAEDSYPGVTRFFLEIGPKRTLDYVQSHVHAIRFFNYILHQSFPDLEERFTLDQDYGNVDKAASMSSRLMPAVFQEGSQSVQMRQVSYIVDCEFAGPLVSVDS